MVEKLTRILRVINANKYRATMEKGWTPDENQVSNDDVSTNTGVGRLGFEKQLPSRRPVP